MGEWSEHFEDYPEENPANWVNGQYNPTDAARQRAVDEQNMQVAKQSEALQRKMFEMATEAKSAAPQTTEDKPDEKP